MSNKPQVVYSVGAAEMNLLAEIDHNNWALVTLGTARLLEAVCPDVWPHMRIRVEPRTDVGAIRRVGELPATAMALRRYKARLTYAATDQFLKLRGEYVHVSKCLAIEAKSVDLQAAAAYYNRTADLWAASREEAQDVWLADAAKEGLEVTIEWDPTSPPC